MIMEKIIICDKCNDEIIEKEEYFLDGDGFIYCWGCLEGTGLSLNDIRTFYKSME